MTQGHDTTIADTLVIGAGPAGLVGASYLARYRRLVVVVDGGDSRAARIPRSRNVPGFPTGISGPQLLARLRRQAEASGVVFTSGEIEGLQRQPGGLFTAQSATGSWRARTILLATGTEDTPLSIPVPKSATLQSIVRWCPVCDGYEATDRRVLIIGDPASGADHALFVRTYTSDLTLLLPEGAVLGARESAALDSAVVHVVRGTPAHFRRCGQGGELELQDGARLRFDVMYPMLGDKPRVSLASSLGAKCCSDGRLEVDAHQETSVAGLYAAGDAVKSLSQICVATSAAALAATAIHGRLKSNYR